MTLTKSVTQASKAARLDVECENDTQWRGKGLSSAHQNTYRLRYGGVFRAYLRDGRTYATPYASFDVWKGFVDRPVFRGLPVTVNGIEGRV